MDHYYYTINRIRKNNLGLFEEELFDYSENLF